MEWSGLAVETRIVGFVGPPKAILAALADFYYWGIYAPNNRSLNRPEGVPFVLCYDDIVPEDLVGASPFITWVSIEYEELLAVVTGELFDPDDWSGSDRIAESAESTFGQLSLREPAAYESDQRLDNTAKGCHGLLWL